MELFRIFFYDAPPLRGRSQNPVDRSLYDFDGHVTAKRNRRLQDTLAVQADVAVRLGEVQLVGWKLRRETIELKTAPRQLVAQDFGPDIEQKGVDLRIGLDVAWLSVKRIVDVIVLVTADSDLVPAMKFARREGLRVYLDPLGHGVGTALHVHSDFVLANSMKGAVS